MDLSNLPEGNVLLGRATVEALRHLIEVLNTEAPLPVYDDWSSGFASGHDAGQNSAAGALTEILPFLSKD